MSATVDIAHLPRPYRGWLDALLAGPIPAETVATCEACPMCPSDGRPAAPGEVRFEPTTKCCTYVPALPNFLVGRLLVDDAPDLVAGRATVAARLSIRVAASPLGLEAPPAFRLLHEAAVVEAGEEPFGRVRAVSCPHYVTASGRCGIWRARPAACATWHCRHVRGAVGQRFWQTAHRLLRAVEHDLSRWCLLELGLEPRVIASSLPDPARRRLATSPDAAGAVDDDTWRARWGPWHGRERELYELCWTLVESLRWSEVSEICGPEVALLAKLAVSAHAALGDRRLPARVSVGDLRVSPDGDQLQLRAYSPLDPLPLPKPALRVLQHFDGRPVHEAIEAVARHEGIDVDEGFVRELVDFEVLVEG